MKTKTLFVEDEPRGVNPYFRELKKYNFECSIAKNGDEALEKLTNESFQLISMDIMFPPGDKLGKNTNAIDAGVKLLRKIRRGKIKNCDPKIKVIVLTAIIDHNIENQITQLGVNAYLKKPIEFYKVIDTFCNTIKQEN